MQIQSAGERNVGAVVPDLSLLEREARTSPDREAYRELARRDGCRLGLLAAAFPSGCVLYTVELTVELFGPEGEVQPSRFEHAAELSRDLARRGYMLSHMDNGWISCERTVRKEQVAAECQVLARLVCRARPAGASE